LVRAIVAEPALSALDVEWLDDTPDVASAMARADLALVAAGSTSWELCCMGLPAIVFSAADNQVPVAAALARRGVVDNLGPHGGLEAATVAGAVVDLVKDGERRAAMSRAGRELVDGRGPARVEALLSAELLTLRQATEADCRLLWEWANDPVVRRWAFSEGPIPWETHTAWFASRLADPHAQIYLAFADDLPVGQVRFEGDGRAAEISVSVAVEARGRGWGPALVDAGVRKLFADTAVERVIARLRPGNTASQRAFVAASFEPEGELSDRTMTWVQYSRSRDAATP